MTETDSVTRLAIHLNDADITLSDGERIIYREPGFAWLDDTGVTCGREAFLHSRIDPRRVHHKFWSDLTTSPIEEKRFSHLSAADLVSIQLEKMWMNHGDGVTELVVVVPPYMATENLSLFLGIAHELNLPVIAMVDSAVAAARRHYKGAIPIHIDLSLHNITVTRLVQPEMAQIDRLDIVSHAGLIPLYELWIKTVADAFVLQSRFDPLHTAALEQLLLNHLERWLLEASVHGKVLTEIEYGGNTYTASVELLELISSATPIYQKIANTLRSICRAEDLPAIQVTERVARMPGLIDILKAKVGGEIFALESGATVRGAFARCGPGTDGISLIRQLVWDQTPIDMDGQVLEMTQSRVPTHMLFDHEAHKINDTPLILGSQETAGGRSLSLKSDMPGVSRKHCALVFKKGQCVIEDYSRYGTFLNGHRVDGSALLQVGDSVRIGSPGFEFHLITTDIDDG
ncbi:MAG: hypothetical protein CMO98_06250 [Woeseia sp.]|nr:hypothetical protein [Woeseia sp.]